MNGIAWYRRSVPLREEFANYVIDTYLCTDPKNRKANPNPATYPASPRPFGAWFDEHTAGEVEPHGPVAYCGVWAATRDSVLRRPRNLYARLLSTVSEVDNHEAIHYIERIWSCMLRPAMYPPKVVWLLWLQGWDKAPALVRRVHQTWVTHNPGWTIVQLDKHNIMDFVFGDLPEDASPQAQSDILRLRLLATRGGVWADSTLACLRPLDTWLPRAFHSSNISGFWMYHGYSGAGPCSWFMISVSHSYMATKWRLASEAFWHRRVLDTLKSPIEYFWMDGLFHELLAKDLLFAEDWSTVPYLNTNAPGGPHTCMLQGPQAYMTDITNNRHANAFPFVVKLSVKPSHESSAFQRAMNDVLEYAIASAAMEQEKHVESYPWDVR
jgi:hypothetical protein